MPRNSIATGPPPVITVQPQSQSAPLLGIVTFSVKASSGTTMSYQWFFDGSAISGATSSSYTILTVLGTSSGVYCVEVSNAGGSVTSSNAYLNVVPPPTIAAQPQSLAVTNGQSVSFSVAAIGTAPFTYQWYFNGSSMGGAGSSAALSLSNVGDGQAGGYFAVVANSGGSVTSSVATLTVYDPPGVQSQPQNQTVTQGQNASFSVTANGSAPFSYQWYFNGSVLSGATNASLALSNVQSNQAGVYAALVSNPAGSITSQSVTLIVDVPAFVTVQLQSQAALQGQNVSFSVGANGTAPLNYHWYFNGSSLGGNSPTVTINNAGTNNAGIYAVVVQNNWGSVTSSVAALAVYVPAGIQAQPTNLMVNVGQNAAFSVTTSGTAPFAYQWLFDGAPLPGATGASLSLPAVQPAQAGNYAAVVANSFGSITSQVATLTVNIPPGITTQPQSQAVAQGQNASFTIVATGSAPLTCQWYFNGSSVGGAGSGQTLSLNNAGNGQAGSYFAVVANAGGSVTSSVVTLTVYDPPGIQNQPQNQTVTQGQSVSFSVTPNGSAPFSYQWYFGSSLIPGASSATLALTNVQGSEAGNYSAVVSNPAGSVTSQAANLTVNIPPTITTQPQSQWVTNGETVSLSVVATSTASLNYHWYFNGSDLGGAGNNPSVTLNSVGTNNVGNYVVVVQNNWGSVTSSVAAVTIVTPPVITQQPQSRVVIPGNDVAFGVVASGAGPLSYMWSFNGAPLLGATNSVLALRSVSAAVAGSYSVVVSNAAGSVASAVATLTVPVAISASGATAPAMTPGGFSFQLSVPPGHPYIIMASSDLIHWAPISTNVSVTGSESFTDTDASNYQSRMYRAVVQ